MRKINLLAPPPDDDDSNLVPALSSLVQPLVRAMVLPPAKTPEKNKTKNKKEKANVTRIPGGINLSKVRNAMHE